jgi:ABC-2 type transport system permease protein
MSAPTIVDAARRSAQPGAGRTHLTGLARLLVLALRRDRLVLPAWVVGIGVVGASSVGGVTRRFASQAERTSAAAFSADNPISRVFNGPAGGADLGALAFAESFTILAVLVAVMAIQAVVRHTRAEEDAGRAELLGSAAVGRHTRLVAAWALAATASSTTGLLYTATMLGSGLAPAGSLAAGAALAAVGLVFAGVATVTAQAFSSARAATGASVATLGGAFLLRAVGDLGGEVAEGGTVLVSAWPSWLSPLGWGQQVRPFRHDRWWVALVAVLVSAALLAAAAVLSARRDLGAGVPPARRGPDRAPRSLRGVFGLAWRLQRGTLLAWIVGLSIIGTSFGGVGEGVEQLVADNQELADVLATLAPGGSLTDTFFAFTMSLLGIAVGGFVVQSLLRLRGEEAGGRLEPVLASAVSRVRWVASHLVIAVAGSAVLLLVVGLTTAATYVAASGADASAMGGIVAAALVQLPAAWVLGGLVVLVFAVAPKWTAALGWGTVGFTFVVGQLGDVLDLPQVVGNLSPFTHIPAVPAVDLDPLPLLVLSAVAVVSTLIGGAILRRRDLAIAA